MGILGMSKKAKEKAEGTIMDTVGQLARVVNNPNLSETVNPLDWKKLGPLFKLAGKDAGGFGRKFKKLTIDVENKIKLLEKFENDKTDRKNERNVNETYNLLSRYVASKANNKDPECRLGEFLAYQVSQNLIQAAKNSRYLFKNPNNN